MSAAARLDAWLGLRVFHPPIIWICQRAKITQWAFYRYAWWIAALWIVWADDHRSTLHTTWIVLFALLRTLSAGLALNRPTTSSRLLRLLFLAFAVFDVVLAALIHRLTIALGVDVLVLAAEYATTITTIPPITNAERAPDRRPVYGGVDG